MPFHAPIAIRNLPTWPTKSKSPTMLRSRQTSVDLSKVSDDFGVPAADDPDPFGVRALEEAGLMIREAGSQSRPTSDDFEFRPSPSSPVFRCSFQSMDAASRRNSRRDSKRSMISVDQGTQTADLPSPLSEPGSIYMSPTQVAAAVIPSPIHENERIEAWSAGVPNNRISSEEDAEPKKSSTSQHTSPLRESWTPVETNYHDVETTTQEEAAPKPGRLRSASQRLSDTLDQLEHAGLSHSTEASPPPSSPDDEAGPDDEEPVIIEQVAHASPAVQLLAPAVISPTVARAKLVTIKSRPAPAIPARNPARQRRPRNLHVEPSGETSALDGHDESSSSYSSSPTRSGFDQNDDHASIPWSEQTSLQDEASMKSRRASKDLALEGEEGTGPPLETGNSAHLHEATNSVSPANQISPEATAPNASLSESIALALTPTNESQATTTSEPPKTTLEKSSKDSDADSALKPSVVDGSITPNASGHALAPKDAISVTATSEDSAPTAPLSEHSPSTPQAHQLPFSPLDPEAHEIEADIASVSDYDGAAHDTQSHADDQSHYDAQSQYDADEEAFHSIPATPFNDSGKALSTDAVEGLAPLEPAPTAATPIVGAVP